MKTSTEAPEEGHTEIIRRDDGPNRFWPNYGGAYGPEGGPPNLPDSGWSRQIVAGCGVALIVSFLGNIWVLYSGLRNKTIRNSPFHLLLLNHSLACLMLAIVAYPGQLYTAQLEMIETDFQSRVCRYAFMTMMWWVCAGLLSNGVVAVNRALSCFPHQTISRVLRGRRATWATIAMIWIVSFLVYGVLAFAYPTGWAVSLFCLPIMEMIKNFGNPDAEVVGDAVRYSCGLSVLVALVMSLMSYIVIIWRLYGQEWLKGTKTMSAQRKREKLHALGVIVIVFVTFCVCWVPLVCAIIWRPKSVAKPAFTVLPMLETAINPLLYMATMPVFRPGRCIRRNTVIHHVSNTLQHNSTVGGQNKM